MADVLMTISEALADAKARKNNVKDVAEILAFLLKADPVMSVLPFRTIDGMAAPTEAISKEQTIGFRDFNDGWESTYLLLSQAWESCYPFGGQTKIDKSIAAAYGKNQAGYIRGQLEGLIRKAGPSFVAKLFYGEGPTASPGEILGLYERIPYSSANCIDAGGVTDDGGLSSIYMVRFGDNDFHCLWGGGVSPVDSDAVLEQYNVVLTGSTGDFPGHRLMVNLNAGIYVGNSLAAGCIANITTDVADHVATVAQLDELIDTLKPYEVGNDAVIFMNRTVYNQLMAEAKTKITFASFAEFGAQEFAMYRNIKIVVTEQITNSEDQKAAA